MSHHDISDPITIASVLVRDHEMKKISRASEPLPLSDGQDLRADNQTAQRVSQKPEWWTSDEWSTPLDVYNRINRVYGPFDLDACCREGTQKCGRYFTKDDDGLVQQWTGRVWVNPPYSNPRPWIATAIDAVVTGHAIRVVMLLPASTDTNWFHELVLPHADVVFMKGRVKFIGWEGTPIGSPKAGTILAIFPKMSAAFSLRGAVDPHDERVTERPRATRESEIA